MHLPRVRTLLLLLPAALLGLSSCLFDSEDAAEAPRPPSDTLAYQPISVSPRMTAFVIPADEPVKLRFEAEAGGTYRIEVRLLEEMSAPFWLNLAPGLRSFLLDRHASSTVLALDILTPDRGIGFLSLSNQGRAPRRALARIVPLVEGIAVDSFESDDRRVDAREFILGTERGQARTLAGADTDWVRFQADSGWQYSVRAFWSSPQHPEAIRTEFLGPDSAPLEVRTSAIGWESSLEARIHRSGTYYLRITDSGWRNREITPDFGSYTLLLEGAPVPDSDGTALTALGLPADGSPHHDRIRAPGDEDWFHFEAKEGLKYIIEARSDTFAASLSLKLDPDDPHYGPALASQLSASPGVARIEWLAPFGGKVYLMASAYAETPFGPQGTGPYVLRILETDRTPKYDLYEPDDSLPQAKTIAVDTEPQERSIHGQDDDIVAFDADSGAIYAVELTGIPSGMLGFCELSFLDAAGSPIADSTFGYSWQAKHLVFHSPRNGRTFLRIAGTRASYQTFPDTAPLAFYRLALRTLPRTASLVDSFESDDTPEEAKPIATDGTPQSRALIGSNWDWIRFRPDSGKTYEILLRAVGAPASADLVHFPAGPTRPLYRSQVPLVEAPFPTGPETRFIWSCDRSFVNVWQQSAFLRIAKETPGAIAFGYAISVRELPEPAIPPPAPQ